MEDKIEIGRMTFDIGSDDKPTIEYDPDDDADFAPWEDCSGSAGWIGLVSFEDLRKLRKWVDRAIDLYPE